MEKSTKNTRRRGFCTPENDYSTNVAECKDKKEWYKQLNAFFCRANKKKTWKYFLRRYYVSMSERMPKEDRVALMSYIFRIPAAEVVEIIENTPEREKEELRRLIKKLKLLEEKDFGTINRNYGRKRSR